ncbi:MAG: transposase [Elusimicrobiota bacterium]|jgi:REP element-mobilizing transposase RayT
MSRGNYGQDIFLDDRDYSHFLQLLSQAKQRFACQIYAFCLLSNHFHILMRMADISVSRAMQWLKSSYAKYFNTRRQRVGHLFQGRFDHRLCGDDRYLMELLRYIHLNPVRARQVERPGDWPWTGHRELCGQDSPRLLDIGFPLSVFHADTATAMALYARFVDAGIEGCFNSPDPLAPEAMLPSWDDAADRISTAADRPSLSVIMAAVSSETGLTVDALRGAGRARPVVRARRLLAQRAVVCGIRPCDIAVFLGCAPSVISRYFRISGAAE